MADEKENEERLKQIDDFAKEFMAILILARDSGICDGRLLEVAIAVLFGITDIFNREEEMVSVLPKLGESLTRNADMKKRDKRDDFSGILERIDPDWMHSA
jgi:hypothetical protein